VVRREHRKGSQLQRLRTKLLSVLAVALVVTAVPAAADAAPKKPKPPAMTPVQATVAAMHPGWNLGNTLDALGDDETAWGNPMVTPEQIAFIKDQGFNSIRIPVTWRGRGTDGTAPYDIDPAYMDRVEEIVDWSLDEGLYVLLNTHHDSWMWIWDMGTDPENVRAEYDAIWTQIADRFKDHPHELLFESINEPQFRNVDFDTQAAALHELNVSFHEIVRASGGNNGDRALVIPTMHTSTTSERMDPVLETILGLDDPNLVATVHDYGFWPFSVNVAGFTRFDDQTRQWTEDNFDRVYDTFIARGIPVILGEYGLLGFDRHTGTVQQGEKLKFFEHFNYYAQQKQMTTMWWDNGQHFNRRTFEWNDPDLFAHVASSWTTRSGTASTDQVYLRSSEPVTAQTVTLNYNGLKLKDLRVDGKKLKAGRDYTLDGDQLTFSAKLLGQLAGSGEHGEQAVIEARFSKGVPWKFHVIDFDTPVLDDAAGTTEDFRIPTAFNGDQLATMEAKYTDGTNAGPHNWTSFKEFEEAFSPRYADGNIWLKPRFFQDVQEGSEVILTFHFWSGEILEYSVTRTGGTAVGVAH
jgi:endoglucanase